MCLNIRWLNGHAEMKRPDEPQLRPDAAKINENKVKSVVGTAVQPYECTKAGLNCII